MHLCKQIVCFFKLTEWMKKNGCLAYIHALRTNNHLNNVKSWSNEKQTAKKYFIRKKMKVNPTLLTSRLLEYRYRFILSSPESHTSFTQLCHNFRFHFLLHSHFIPITHSIFPSHLHSFAEFAGIAIRTKWNKWSSYVKKSWNEFEKRERTDFHPMDKKSHEKKEELCQNSSHAYEQKSELLNMLLLRSVLRCIRCYVETKNNFKVIKCVMEYTAQIMDCECVRMVCCCVRCNWHHRRRYNEKKTWWILFGMTTASHLCVVALCWKTAQSLFVCSKHCNKYFSQHTKQEFSFFNEFHMTFSCKTWLPFVSICISFLFNLKMHSGGTKVSSVPRLERFNSV